MRAREDASSRRLVGLWPALVAGLAACNHTPVEDIGNSFTLKVEVGTGDENRVKIDFLWVIDNSTSMCQEQAALSDNFDTFVESLEQSFEVDARIAVTTVDARCTNNGVDVFAARGKFNQHVDRTVAITCAESRKFPCTQDGECSDCSVLGECDSTGAWRCDLPQIETCNVNPNGSFNTSCDRKCATDEECRALFGDPRYICLNASGTTGCVIPPPTDECPDELPPFLEKNEVLDNSSLFKCIAHVGVTQAGCLDYEQPLRAAYMALDPVGPNPEQAASFLRDDAYLVVIIVSDEEDCSVTVATENDIKDTEAYRCGVKPTTDDGGPLAPVAHFVNRFKSLKSDPGRVIVATIAGDSLAASEAERVLARQSYVDSKKAPLDCNAGTYICDSDVGTADYGGRFFEFAGAFGPNGIPENICNEDGIGPALISIAEAIVDVVNHVCLPKPILTGLTVTRIRDGVETALVEGAGTSTYTILRGAEDCAVNGVIMPAISPNDPPRPGDELRIVYQGDPQLQ